MAKRVFTIKKENGQISNVSEIEQTIKLWLGDIPNGTYLLALEKPSKPRSNEQNRYMWLIFSVIADAWTEATGRVITREVVHDAYCGLFLPIETPKCTIAGKTSTLTTEQFKEFLDRVIIDAQTEYGIDIPDPDDYNFEAWARMHER